MFWDPHLMPTLHFSMVWRNSQGEQLSSSAKVQLAEMSHHIFEM